MSAAPRISFFGAAGDTGNLGVSALLFSALETAARLAPDVDFTVFDNGWGVRPAERSVDGLELRFRYCGARLSRRIHRPESYWNMRVSRKLGGLGNPGMRALLASDSVWDVTGGDSFGDLYGPKRLEAMLAPKELALDSELPLVLLPQTYGPFRDPELRRRAAAIVERATLAWARDERSYAILRELAGAGFDPERHRSGVDMAFGLSALRPPEAIYEPIGEWVESGGPVVGLNVSGLIYNDLHAREKYGLEPDYRRIVQSICIFFLEQTDAKILLIPHVVVSGAGGESDVDACRLVAEVFEGTGGERIRILGPLEDPGEVKWVLSKLDWFCGTRMHPCVGALSMGVPTAGLAYSLKAQGVFETCGQGERVFDLRSQGGDEIFEGVRRSWEERAVIRRELEEVLPRVRSKVVQQMELNLAVRRDPA